MTLGIRTKIVQINVVVAVASAGVDNAPPKNGRSAFLGRVRRDSPFGFCIQIIRINVAVPIAKIRPDNDVFPNGRFILIRRIGRDPCCDPLRDSPGMA